MHAFISSAEQRGVCECVCWPGQSPITYQRLLLYIWRTLRGSLLKTLLWITTASKNKRNTSNHNMHSKIRWMQTIHKRRRSAKTSDIELLCQYFSEMFFVMLGEFCVLSNSREGPFEGITCQIRMEPTEYSSYVMLQQKRNTADSKFKNRLRIGQQREIFKVLPLWVYFPIFAHFL